MGVKVFRLVLVTIVLCAAQALAAAPAPSIVYPNGGESFAAGSTITVRWSVSGQVQPGVDLQYTTNNGGSWSTLANGVAGTSKSWTLPNVNSSQVRVKVITYDAAWQPYTDQSNSTFSIVVCNTPGSFSGTSPANGTTFDPATSVTLSWGASSGASRYDVKFGESNPPTYLKTVTGTSTSVSVTPGRTYYWFITSYPDCDGSKQVSTSQRSFSIRPTPVPRVTYPNGGESFQGGQSINVTWSVQNAITSGVELQYTTNNGSSWTSFATGVTGTSRNWTLPTVTSTQVRVKVMTYDTGGAPYTDQSDGTFTINSCPTPGGFSASSPSNGANLDPATSVTLSWGASSGASRYDVKFGESNPPAYLKTVTGTSTSVTVAPGKTYYWFITAYPDCDGSKQVSTSQRSFSVRPTPVPRVTYPNGGESFQGGQTITVAWTVQNAITSGVELQYTTDNGGSWTSFAAGVTGTSRDWTLPAVTSTQMRVKVMTYDSGGTPYTDQSDGTFTIASCSTPGAFSASSPANGASLDPGTSVTLSWGASAGASRYDVKFGESNPPVYLKTVTGTSTSVTVASGKTYYWFITAYPDCDGSKQVSTAQRSFTVKPTPVPRVTYPNGGEVLQSGQTATVSWTVQNQINAGVDLQYTTDNGATWQSFAAGVAGTSTTWTLPAVTSTQARVKVLTYDGAGNAYTDQSDGTFTITSSCPTPAAFSLVSPANAASLDPVTPVTLAWGPSSGASRYDVKFGETNPPAYLKTVTGTSTTVTVTPGKTYYWFITAYPDCDGSKQVSTAQRSFNVKPVPVPRVISPNGGESLQGGQAVTVSWAVQNQIKPGVDLQYTADNGATWQSFATAVAGTSTSWTLPSINSNQVRVKVLTYDGAGNAYTDQSDGTFTITTSTCTTPAVFNLSSPANGASLDPATSVTLAWGPSSGASRYDVKFGETNPPAYLKTVIGTSTSVTVTPGKTYFWFITAYPDCDGSKQVSTAQRSFSVRPAPVPRVISPNGGESLQGGQAVTVSWTVQNQINAGVDLQYTTDNGATWQNFAAGVAGTSISWTVPAVTSTRARVKVLTYDGAGNAYTDQSDDTFTIAAESCTQPAAFNLSSPANGASLDPSTSVTLAWEPASGAGRYDVRFGESNPPAYLKTVTGTSAAVTVTPGRTYYWFITAYPDCDSAKRVNSAQRSFRVTEVPVAQSDLVVQSLSIAPATGPAGTSVAVQVTIRNQGTGAANASVTNIRINTSSTTAPPASAPAIGAAITTPGLAPGATYSFTHTGTIPSLAAGPYRVWVSLDGTHSANQSNESNDHANTPFTVTAPVDVVTLTADSRCDGSEPVVQLTWTELQGATSYVVLRDTAVLATGGLSYLDTTVEAGRSYRYAVRAMTATSTVESNVVSVNIPAKACEIGPECLRVDVSTNPSDGGTTVITPEAPCYPPGDVVTLSTSAHPGFEFAGWTASDGVLAAPAAATTAYRVTTHSSVAANYRPTTQSLVAGFDILNPAIHAGERLEVMDRSLGFPTSWSWDFDGDGRVDATTRKASFLYRRSGKFTIRLTIAAGGASASTTQAISVSEAQPAIELIDPHEELMDGLSVTTDAALLANRGRVVYGAAADGVTRVVLRSVVSGPGNMKYEIDGSDTLADGFLSAVESPGSERATVTVPARRVGSSWVTYCVYRTPSEFTAREGFDGEKQRDVDIMAMFVPSGKEAEAPRQETLTLIRPPLLFVHGLWSEAAAWTFKATTDSRWEHLWDAVDYERSNYRSFSDNDDIVLKGLTDLLKKVRTDYSVRDGRRGVAAAQADVVGHSMGGILARLMTQLPDYRSYENFGAGFIHKLITLDTPHLGSPVATKILELRREHPVRYLTLAAALLLNGKRTEGGAVTDLAVGSAALQSLDTTAAPAHALTGAPSIARYACLEGYIAALLSAVARQPEIVWGFEDNDGLVGIGSQRGGLPASATGKPVTTRDGCHTHNIQSLTYSDNVVALLNASSSDRTTFSQFPAHPRLSILSAPAIETTAEPEFVHGQLTLTVDIAQARPGETIVLRVSSPHALESVIYGSKEIITPGTTAPDFATSVIVPETAAGTIELQAFAAGTNQIPYDSNVVRVRVQNDASLLSLSVTPDDMLIDAVGTVRGITVMGKYSDGVQRELTDDPSLSFTTSNASIATISREGVTARGRGSATLMVSRGSVRALLSVRVEPPVRRRTMRH